MLFYRIVAEKYANSLSASGIANRWNKKNEMVIYVSQSRSLATLEMIVHRNNINLDNNYRVLVISLDDGIEKFIDSVDLANLPKNWRSINSYHILQNIGSKWYKEKKFLIMKVPSVIIPQEFNYVINTNHINFKEHIKIIGVESFFWDDRLY